MECLTKIVSFFVNMQKRTYKISIWDILLSILHNNKPKSIYFTMIDKHVITYIWISLFCINISAESHRYWRKPKCPEKTHVSKRSTIIISQIQLLSILGIAAVKSECATKYSSLIQLCSIWFKRIMFFYERKMIFCKGARLLFIKKIDSGLYSMISCRTEVDIWSFFFKNSKSK